MRGNGGILRRHTKWLERSLDMDGADGLGLRESELKPLLTFGGHG
jgi:hypothetical protein